MKRSAFLVGLTHLVAVFGLAVAAGAQTPQRQRHQIVFAIDNSGSMSQTDPTSLRGVAAGLILDGAALDAELEAGLVLFNDRVETEGKLFSVAELRKRLVPGPGGIPDPTGATNMEAGLAQALALFQGSTAQRRTLVLISDGNPATLLGADPAQEKKILEQLVPHAQSLGVRIYALGARGRVDDQFLDALTRPTGGSTLLFRDSRQLLDRAKELVGRQDDVHLIASEKVSGNTMDFEFDLPPGTDRARITVVLDDAMRDDLSGFLEGQISFSLDGPVQSDPGSIYRVKKKTLAMVGAWTTFLSQSGHYRLTIGVSKPGISEHGGLRVYVEALSVLKLEAELAPIGQTSFYFDEELEIEANLKGGDGSPLDPQSYQLSGYIDLPTGAREALSFAGRKATFRVPAVLGTHRVVIEADALQLGERTTEVSYRARQDDPCELVATPDAIRFGATLGPENLEIEAAFRIDPIFGDGSRARDLTMATTGNSGLGTLSLETDEGAVVAFDGRPRTRLESSGRELVVKVRLDGSQNLSTQKRGKYRGLIVFQVPKGGCELAVPFEFDLRIPRFELEDARGRVTAWWDPNRRRRFSLGSLTSDIVEPSTFTLALSQDVQSSNKIGPIAGLRVALDGDDVLEADPEATNAGITTFGPIELPARGSVDLDLILEPTAIEEQRFWTHLGKAEHPFSIALISELGMTVEHEVRFVSLGGPWAEAPWWGPVSPHGLHLLRWILLGSGLGLVLFLARKRLVFWQRFFRFRPGTVHPLPVGELRVGEHGGKTDTELSLPASGQALRETSIASVRNDPSRPGSLALRDTGAGAVLGHNARPITGWASLQDGDSITIEDEEEVLWELEYLGFDDELGVGEVDIIERPRVPTLTQIARKVLISVALLAILGWFLSTKIVATLVYAIPGSETFWLQLFGKGN